MRTGLMCFTAFRVPRCRVYSLVNTWWNRFDSLSTRPCKDGHNLKFLSSTVCEQRATRKWTRRPITTMGDGRCKGVLSSVANIKHVITDEVTTSVSTNSTKKKIDGSKTQQIQCTETTDFSKLLAEDKELVDRATFIVFDLETTGLGKDDKIIEIALVDIDGGENSTFHTLVNPERVIPKMATEIHGITSEMVSEPGVPRMEELLPILLQFVKSRQKPRGFVVLVAHNARAFDVRFLLAEFARCSAEIPPDWRFLDTLILARELMKSKVLGGAVQGSSKLQDLREHYGIELEGSAHRAMSDVMVLSLVLKELTLEMQLSTFSLLERTFSVDELASNSKKVKKKDSS